METWIWIFRILCAALSLLAAILLYRALLHDRSRGRRRCPRCWYDLAGVDGLRCPECGRQARRERSLLRTRRHWRLMSFALVVAAFAYAAGLAPRAVRAGTWWSAVPTPALVIILQFYDDEDAQVFANMQARLRGTGAKLSTWERLLLARRCGKILLEPPTPASPFLSPPTFASPAPAQGGWSYTVDIPARPQAQPAAQEPRAKPPSNDEIIGEAMRAEARDLKAQADSAFDAKRMKLALDTYTRLRTEFSAHLAPEDLEHVEIRTIQARLILDRESPKPPPARPTNPRSGILAMLSPGSNLQSQALDTLNLLGTDARAALPSLIACIDDRASPYRLSAIGLVGRIGPQARGAVPALARQLTDTDTITPVLDSLLKLGADASAASPQLRELLRADYNSIRRTLDIVRILNVTIPQAELIEDLRKVVESDRAWAPTAAVRGLEFIGKPAAVTIPDLARAARRRPEVMSTAVIQVIASFGPASVPALTEFVETGDDYQQFVAACWLGTMRSRAAPATAALIQALGSPDRSVRAQAALALGRIGAASAKLELIRVSTSDPVPWVRETAAEALDKIDAPAAQP